MAINLDDHKVYVESHKMDMVPLSIALQAISETYEYEKYQVKLDKAMKELNDAFKEINNSVEELDDKDSTRES